MSDADTTPTGNGQRRVVSEPQKRRTVTHETTPPNEIDLADIDCGDGTGIELDEAGKATEEDGSA